MTQENLDKINEALQRDDLSPETEALLKLIKMSAEDIQAGRTISGDELVGCLAQRKLKLSREDSVAVVDALESNEVKFNDKFIDAAKRHKEIIDKD